MNNSLQWYFKTWKEIMFGPEKFFSSPQGQWHEEPVTFAAITAWILSVVIAVVVFVIQYIPIGLYLVEGLSVWQLVLVSPVIFLVSFVFFVMTLLIIGGFAMLSVLGLLFVFGAILHIVLRLLGGQGSPFVTIKASFYSGAALLFAVVPFILSMFTKYKLLGFPQLSIAENLVYYGACLNIYFLWSIGSAKVNEVPRWKGLLAAVLPVVILIFFGVVFHSKIFPKLESFLM